MADIADIANDRIQQELDQRLAMRQSPRVVRLAEECEECGDPIPFERVQALALMGCLYCVDCQRLHERGIGRVRGRVANG